MVAIRQWGWEYAANDQRDFVTNGDIDPLKKSIKVLCPGGHRGGNRESQRQRKSDSHPAKNKQTKNERERERENLYKQNGCCMKIS